MDMYWTEALISLKVTTEFKSMNHCHKRASNYLPITAPHGHSRPKQHLNLPSTQTLSRLGSDWVNQYLQWASSTRYIAITIKLSEKPLNEYMH